MFDGIFGQFAVFSIAVSALFPFIVKKANRPVINTTTVTCLTIHDKYTSAAIVDNSLMRGVVKTSIALLALTDHKFLTKKKLHINAIISVVVYINFADEDVFFVVHNVFHDDG